MKPKAERVIDAINDFFKKNPKRKLACLTYYTVRKNHIQEDVMKHFCSKCGLENEVGDVCICQI